ncbi:MAG TPA: hypothetical protein VF657_15725 [Actinoplanes sp.]
MTAGHAATLRALVRGDLRAYERRVRVPAEPGWEEFLATAFVVAVDRRFGPAQAPASVIRFVAGVRERYDRTGCEIDPGTAEALVWAALGRRPAPPADGTATARSLLLLGLLTDEGLTEHELTAFLTDVLDLVSAADELHQSQIAAGDDGQGQKTDGEPEPRVAVNRSAVVDGRPPPDGQRGEPGEERHGG